VGVLFGLLADPGRHGLDVDGAAGVEVEDWTAQAKRGRAGEQPGPGVLVEGVVDVAWVAAGGPMVEAALDLDRGERQKTSMGRWQAARSAGPCTG
jgi:hypothetical protein